MKENIFKAIIHRLKWIASFSADTDLSSRYTWGGAGIASVRSIEESRRIDSSAQAAKVFGFSCKP